MNMNKYIISYETSIDDNIDLENRTFLKQQASQSNVGRPNCQSVGATKV
jgi:hypothetical protein